MLKSGNIFFLFIFLLSLINVSAQSMDGASDDSVNPNNPIVFGLPSKCENREEDLFMPKDGYSLSYNSKLLIPNWVMWHLCSDDLGDESRNDTFRADVDLPDDFYAVKRSDYQYSVYGFDRGHLCPSADRTLTQTLNSETFLMTNMVPQAPDLNRKLWMHFESYCRSLVRQGYELYIFAGPSEIGGTSSKGDFDKIRLFSDDRNELFIRVPKYCWKIVLVLTSGDDDFYRVNKDSKVISIYALNAQGIQRTGDWEQFITTVDFIEEKTGFDFFNLLPDEVEDAIESFIWQG